MNINFATMATIKQINKQLETAQKRISDYKRKVEMYKNRTIKACESVNISIDLIVESEREYRGHKLRDYKLPVDVNIIGFEKAFRITDNYESMKNNERYLSREIMLVESLKEQLSKMESDARNYQDATTGLSNALEHSMTDFKKLWFDKMKEWYKAHYSFINSKLQSAKANYERANKCRKYFERTRNWSWRKTSKIMRLLDNVCKHSCEIINDPAANMDFDSYMKAMKQKTSESWNNGIRILTNKCFKFGLNEKAIQVKQPEMTSKGFSAIISDGTQRIIDVRVIWAAEYSTLVIPHIRYIATQRNK
jgi:hypothetical protein